MTRCFFFVGHVQPVDHLLLLCEMKRALLELIFALFGVSSVLPSLVRDTLLGCNDCFVGNSCKKVWQANPLCLFWMLGMVLV